MYEVFDHTADLGLRVCSATLSGLMEDAAAGLMTIIAGDLGQIRRQEQQTFEVRGEDPAYLLFDWLNELLYAFEAGRMLYAAFKVRLEPEKGLVATARGERYDPERHVLAHEVKAITYHELEVRETAAGWEGVVIVDI